MSATPSRRFELTQIDQHASGLVQLPTELRMPILRLLMKHEEPLLPHRSYTSFGAFGTIKRKTLSSQIMGTCQSLYHDAYYVLYCENIVTVRFCKGVRPRRTFDLEVLDATACFFHPVPKRGLKISLKKEPYTQRHYLDLETRPLFEALDTLARFDRVQVTFVETNDYMIVSRCLRRAIHDKHVIVDLGSHVLLTHPTNPYELYDKPKHPHFSPACFSIWKCKSISFQNGCRRHCCKPNFNKLVKLITNNNIQVHDLLPDVWRIKDVLSIFSDLSVVLRTTKGIFRMDRKRILHALYNNDIDMFEQARRQIMEQARQALTAYQDLRRRQIEFSILGSAFGTICDLSEDYYVDNEDEPWSANWNDYIIERQVASVEKSINDTWKLMNELLGEDDLLNGAEIQHTNTPQQSASYKEAVKFTCSCGECKIIDGRGVWRSWILKDYEIADRSRWHLSEPSNPYFVAPWYDPDKGSLTVSLVTGRMFP